MKRTVEVGGDRDHDRGDKVKDFKQFGGRG